MAVTRSKGFMDMLEAATKRSRELDSGVREGAATKVTLGHLPYRDSPDWRAASPTVRLDALEGRIARGDSAESWRIERFGEFSVGATSTAASGTTGSVAEKSVLDIASLERTIEAIKKSTGMITPGFGSSFRLPEEKATTPPWRMHDLFNSYGDGDMSLKPKRVLPNDLGVVNPVVSDPAQLTADLEREILGGLETSERGSW